MRLNSETITAIGAVLTMPPFEADMELVQGSLRVIEGSDLGLVPDVDIGGLEELYFCLAEEIMEFPSAVEQSIRIARGAR